MPCEIDQFKKVSRAMCLEDMSGSTMMNRVTLMQSFSDEKYGNVGQSFALEC